MVSGGKSRVYTVLIRKPQAPRPELRRWKMGYMGMLLLCLRGTINSRLPPPTYSGRACAPRPRQHEADPDPIICLSTGMGTAAPPAGPILDLVSLRPVLVALIHNEGYGGYPKPKALAGGFELFAAARNSFTMSAFSQGPLRTSLSTRSLFLLGHRPWAAKSLN